MEDEIVRNKILQVFNFVKALNELRNPVQLDVREYKWTLWLDELPTHPTIKVKNNEIDASTTNNEVSDEEVILKVRRPIITDCPQPPQELKPWISGRWKDIDGKVEILDRIEILNENGEKITITLEENEKLMAQFQHWNKERNDWIIKETPARQAKSIFNRLYKLYSEIEKEAETVELVLGDGILTWSLDNGSEIYHPVLIQKVKLEFNSNIPEFKICYTESCPELYNSLFRSISEINFNELAKCNNDLEINNYDPMEKQKTDEFLHRLVVALSPEGEFINSLTKIFCNKPIISRSPVIFLRKRNLGYNLAIESVIDDISNGSKVSSFLKRIVGSKDTSINLSHDQNNKKYLGSANGEDKDILFTKPANEEQLLVARQLKNNGAVLVQGPPGTGKTHTIANLVGHLLSEGKSVLVTSYSEKALKVLRDKIVEPLKPLCLPVLSSVESRKEMEKTLNAMDEKQSSANM
jgi:hypothetical protein